MKKIELSVELPTLDQIKMSDMLCFSVTKEEVENNSFERVYKFFNLLRIAKDFARSKVMFNFEYDMNEKEVYEIPGIKQFMIRLFKEVPELFYYIHLGNHDNLKVLCLCLFDVKQVVTLDSKNKGIEVIIDKPTMTKILLGVADYSEKIKDEDLDSLKLITDAILGLFNRG